MRVGATIAALLVLMSDSSTIAQTPKPERPPPKPILRLNCPTELEPLTRALLRDLPAYMNRFSSRNRVRNSTYAIVASQPEFEPLPIGSSQYPPDQSLKQVFFTVLERQYSPRQVSQSQQFHWLFLAQTPSGWRLALLYSRFGSSPTAAQKRLSPPRETSQGVTGQSVQTWLRDCQAGAIRL